MLSLFRRKPPESIRGQVVLITGASRGLGFLIAREFTKHGCRLVICARDDERLQRAATDLRQRGSEVLAIPCDVGDREQVRRLVAEAVSRFGQIDIVVNNAGVVQVAPFEDQTLEDFEVAMSTMYWGVVYTTLAVLPLMRERSSGRIVNITSIGGKASVPHLLPYSSAKFAAVGFSEGLRAELAGTGISVTTVVPGLMRTGSHLNALFGGRAEQEATWFSLGATLPLVAIGGDHAARSVVNAAIRRQPNAVLGLPARFAMWTHGLFPGLTARLFGVTDRYVLPEPPEEPSVGLERGGDALRRSRFPLLRWLTSLGRSAARRANQFPRKRPPPPRGDVPRSQIG